MELEPIEVRSFDEEYKCGGCNWACITFYSMEGPITLDNGDKDDPRPTGLCAHCMMELLVELSHR